MWLIFARKLPFSVRMHLFMGIMAYLGSPLWFLFLALGTWIAWDRYSSELSQLPFESYAARWFHIDGIQQSIILTAVIFALLFLPKILAVTAAILTPSIRRSFGGTFRIMIGATMETIVSMLLAPCIMLAHSLMVLSIILGRAVGWGNQNRETDGTAWGDAFRFHAPQTILGLAWTAVAINIGYHSKNPGDFTSKYAFALWMTPILLGLLLSAPVSVWTSRSRYGRALLKRKILATPEELNPPAVIRLADNATAAVDPAPGRVNLIGEHIDYCDGFVMPFAIDRYIVIAGCANGTSQARITSAISEEVVTLDLTQPQQISEPKWANYLRGVIRGFQDRGHHIPGFDAYILSSIPGGAGLSSSAALECATATFLEGLLDTVLDTKEKALLCQKAEHDFAHVPCGIMDQFASAFGKPNRLVLIDCQTGEPELVPFENPDLTVLISNTMVHHELSDGGYAARRKHTEDGLAILGKASWRDVTAANVQANWEKLGDPVNRRARHVVGEISRTIAAAAALARNDFETLGPLMAASHDSLRDDFEVSCKELDIMVEIARKIGRNGGVIGTRMTGGGFGGSTVTLCESRKASEIAATLGAEYEKATGIKPQIFASRPSQGAHLVG
jgi:galactokinase